MDVIVSLKNIQFQFDQPAFMIIFIYGKLFKAFFLIEILALGQKI